MRSARLALWSVCVGVAVAGAGCGAQLQEAASLPQGEWEISAGVEGVAAQLEEVDDVVFPNENESSPDGDESRWSPSKLIGGQVGARRGLGDGVEVYTYLGVPVGWAVGGKVQLVGDYGRPGFLMSLSTDINLAIPIVAGVSGGAENAALGLLASLVLFRSRVYLGWGMEGGASVYVAPGLFPVVGVIGAFNKDPEGLVPSLSLGGRSPKLSVGEGDIQLCGEVGVVLLGEKDLSLSGLVGVAF